MEDKALIFIIIDLNKGKTSSALRYINNGNDVMNYVIGENKSKKYLLEEIVLSLNFDLIITLAELNEKNFNNYKLYNKEGKTILRYMLDNCGRKANWIIINLICLYGIDVYDMDGTSIYDYCRKEGKEKYSSILNCE